MNTDSIDIIKKPEKIIYKLRGPLNHTLKTKLKNKTSHILNNAKNIRFLSRLELTPSEYSETKEILERARTIKPDLREPAAQIAVLYNNLNTNILTNSKSGTYITLKNKDTHFNNIGTPIKFGSKIGHFLRRGSGSKLLLHVINEQRNAGVKTLFVHPDNKELEKYYSKFGFKTLLKVPFNLNRPKFFYESSGYGHLMYLEL
jgi:hypothetical protein